MFLRHIAPALAWALLILLLCAIPGDQLPEMHLWALLNFDKFVHAFLFLMQVLLLSIAFRKQQNFPKLKSHGLSAALSLGVIYGVATEFMQLFIFTGRQYDLLDVLANITGCILGISAFFLIYGRR